MPRTDRSNSFAKRFHTLVWGPQLLAFLPALCLAAYWIVGEAGLIACALGLPILWSMFGGFDAPREDQVGSNTPIAEKTTTDIAALLRSTGPNERALLLSIAIEDSKEISTRLNSLDLQFIQDRLQLRYSQSLRANDIVTRTGTLTWMIAIAPGPNLDLAAAIQQASRMQGLVDEPFFV